MTKLRFFKRLSCVLILLLGVSAYQAQAQFTIGLKVAGNGTNYRNLTQFSAGVDAGIFMRMGDQFYFQPELYYSFKSSNIQDVSSFVSEVRENQRLKQHFVDLPLLLGFHFINNENFKVHLFLGPRFGFRVGSNLKEIDPLVDEGGNLQWAGQIGFGFDFWRFTLDARYDLAVDKLMKKTNADGTSTDRSWMQNMIVLSLGFKFIK